MKRLPHVRAAIHGMPWAITKDSLEAICEIVELHANGGEAKPFIPKQKRGRRCPECKSGVAKPVMVSGAWGPVHNGQYKCGECAHMCDEDALPPYEIINGVAILPLTGPLFPKANMMTMYSGATSYEEYGSTFSQAMQDSDVKVLLPLADSPGGSCLGMSEACSMIRSARESGSKPIIGLINPMACSAAYAIMSQCDELYCTESAMVGNIGVRFRMSNWDRAERNEGNDPLEIATSDIKATGIPQSKDQYQGLIDMMMAYFGQFKEIVQQGRPRIDIEAVSDARVYIGKDAVKIGLCDGVSTLEKIIARVS